MTTIPNNIWKDEFGIDTRPASRFFVSKTEVDAQSSVIGAVAHVVRRAFDDLDLSAVLCDQNSPLIYFAFLEETTPQQVAEIHRRFWNHGAAPILVIVTSREVQILSSLSEPVAFESSAIDYLGTVDRIQRASLGLLEFLPSVQSGAFFHAHQQWFNPKRKVDQTLLDQLQATRQELTRINIGSASDEDLDALLCRLVFTCYLFDRKIIGENYLVALGISNATHLRDVLRLSPSTEAKSALYRLFEKLTEDFNGDLFSDDLDAEMARLSDEHLSVVADFFSGTNVVTGQQSIWPYDFGLIPIETVSAIYERFLKPSDKEIGSFYTPRFLAEMVLDVALKHRTTITGKRFLDPACGSGIFLVGLFNQLAEEWRRANPNARNDVRANSLIRLLQSNIFGVDINPTACRITAFSLYLAFLDQLSPRDIQHLQLRGRVLPHLVVKPEQSRTTHFTGNIWCGDFFDDSLPFVQQFDLVVGNPPWGSIADVDTPASRWCSHRQLTIPDKQIASAFMWKAADHIADNGRICFVLPHGILFNHNKTAITFQRGFIERFSVELVVNLTDYQSFLFSEARHPAIIIAYGGQKPEREHRIDYWTPKADWKVTRAEIVTIAEYDRAMLSVASILQDLDRDDAPQIWKRTAWATPRDRRLIDRLSDLPRLRTHVRQAGEKSTSKPWLIAEGFQPLGENDPVSSQRFVHLPSNLFVPARSENLNLFLLPDDCQQLDSSTVITRRQIKDTGIFESPHVLVSQGFGRVAYADFPVAFRHALRGISGPTQDRNILIFLAAYLRSPIAQYFLFHTSTNWGVSRKKVHVEELLRLPFPLPLDCVDPQRAGEIIEQVAEKVLSAANAAQTEWSHREGIVKEAQTNVEPLMLEYFDILDTERILIEDTLRLTVPSFRPSIHKKHVPAIAPASSSEMESYLTRVCQTLNRWATDSRSQVVGTTTHSQKIGIGIAVLERTNNLGNVSLSGDTTELLRVLKLLQETASVKVNTFELLKGVKVFDGNRLFIVKPLGRRHWSETAALNDADEIAASLLMRSVGEMA